MEYTEEKISVEEKELRLLDKTMLNKAFEISKLSPANKRKVGAIIVDMEIGSEFIIEQGWNRMFEKLDESCENTEGKSYECVIHAEEDAITKMFKKKNYRYIKDHRKTIYVTYSPCMNCCKLIAHSGIERLVFANEHKTNFVTPEIINGFSPFQFLIDMGVSVTKYDNYSLEEVFKPNDEEIEIKPTLALALVYHSADNDGLMSGYLLSKVFAREIESKEAKLIPYNYGTDDDFLFDENYAHFIFVDVTPPFNWIKERIETIEETGSLKIYDHHKPKYDEVANYFESVFPRNMFYYFNEEKSGCKIFYDNVYVNHIDYSQNMDKLKFFVYLISDYDLWNYDKIDFNTNAYRGDFENIGIEYYEKELLIEDILTFDVYMRKYNELDRFIKIIDYIIECFDFSNLFHNDILKEGRIIIEKIKSDNNGFIYKGVFMEEFPAFFYCGYPNYFLQKTLLEKYDNLKYWIGFQIDLEKQHITFSVRSKSQNDCNEIAKKFEGGGHYQAAGFKTTLDVGFALIKNPHKILI